MYIPKIDYIYPEKPDEQIIKIVKKRNIKLNEKYYSGLVKLSFKLGQFLFRIIFLLIAVPAVKHRYHLKIVGKENIKPFKKELKKSGFITVSNHVFLWDYLALCASMKMGFPNVPAWGKLVSSKFGKLFSFAGIIPIPEDALAFKSFYKFVDNVFKENKWVHIYPETGLWYYYVPIRPFKRGAAYFAVQYSKPIIPIGYSFRERKGLSKLFNHHDPFVTVNIGKPVYPIILQNKRVSVTLLNETVRNQIIKMVGFKDEAENQSMIENGYSYENDHYYTKL